MSKPNEQPKTGPDDDNGVETLDSERRSPPEAASVDPEEVARFSAMAAEWWDPNGKFRPLHKFNPARLSYIRETLCNHFDLDASARRPFGGLSILDIGCGGGLVSEPMAIMGAQMTGADASHQNIMTARTHAAEQGVEIDYRCQSAESLAEDGARFDVILNLEVIEHVADLGSFMKACGSMVKPGGLMIVATLNRTLKAFALAVVGAEYILGWLPRGTHQWEKFVTPRELDRALDAAGLKVLEHAGVSYNPVADRWSISDDTDVNYMAVAMRPA